MEELSNSCQAQEAWQKFLKPEDFEVPLSCFRHSIKHRLAIYLNQPVAVLTENNLCPDWGGLAELIGFDGMEIEDISRYDSPGKEVINRWIGRVNLNPTVGWLVKYLVILQREDILTDLSQAIGEEIYFHRNRHENFNRMEQPIQDPSVSSHEMEKEYSHILTIDDTMTTIAIYDAFVCYEFKDIKFVQEMIRRLEDPRRYRFRLFVPGRNNLVGTNSYEMMTRIISERCRHMIVVLSNNFIQSNVCNFQATYAFSLNPGARDKKMVPIKIEECPIPETLRIMACCDFTNNDLLDWSWQRLEGSIRRPMPNKEFVGPQVWETNQQPSQDPVKSLQSSSSSSSLSSSSSSPSLASTSAAAGAVGGAPAPVASGSSVPTSSNSLPRQSKGDSGFISGFRPSSSMSNPLSRQNPSGSGESSMPQDSSHSNVKSNVSKALKRLTNFASSPRSKKKEKMETTPC